MWCSEFENVILMQLKGSSQTHKKPKSNLPLILGSVGLFFILLFLAGYITNEPYSSTKINLASSTPFDPQSQEISEDPAAFQTLALQIDYKGQQKLERKKQEAD